MLCGPYFIVRRTVRQKLSEGAELSYPFIFVWNIFEPVNARFFRKYVVLDKFRFVCYHIIVRHTVRIQYAYSTQGFRSCSRLPEVFQMVCEYSDL